MKAKQQPARVILPSRRSVREWLEAFAACVRARDFAGGRILFAEDAMGFGTVATVAESRAVLIREQWRRVWTRTAGFRFERKGSRVEVSPDGLMAVAMVRWRASNNPANPRRLDRRGRATVVLRRPRVDAAWTGLFTHFSFDPPQGADQLSREKF